MQLSANFFDGNTTAQLGHVSIKEVGMEYAEIFFARVSIGNAYRILKIAKDVLFFASLSFLVGLAAMRFQPVGASKISTRKRPIK